jgi:hypothetical protein
MEAIRSSETSVLIRATRYHLPEDDNHHSHRRGNLKSYKEKLASCLPLTRLTLQTLESEATCSSETSADFQQTTQGYIREVRTLHDHRYGNLIFYTN